MGQIVLHQWKNTYGNYTKTRKMPVGFREKKKRFVKYLQIVSKINTIKVDKEKVIPKLSTGKKPTNAVKWTYTQSYPLYPQK